METFLTLSWAEQRRGVSQLLPQTGDTHLLLPWRAPRGRGIDVVCPQLCLSGMLRGCVFLFSAASSSVPVCLTAAVFLLLWSLTYDSLSSTSPCGMIIDATDAELSLTSDLCAQTLRLGCFRKLGPLASLGTSSECCNGCCRR